MDRREALKSRSSAQKFRRADLN